jgi:hypothetical protein
VLDRIRIEVLTAVPGVFPLTLTSAAHVDTDGNSWAPDAIADGTIGLNTASPCGTTDLKTLSQTVTFPTQIMPGANVQIDVDKMAHNNGPFHPLARATTTFSTPAGCTVDGQASPVTLGTSLGQLIAGTTVPNEHLATVRCTGAGPVDLPVNGCTVVDPADTSHFDVSNGNNCMLETISFTVGPADSDLDGYSDAAEAGTPLCGDARNEDGIIAFGASDDSVVDDGCPGGPQQEGAYSESQFNIGTSPTDACGTDGFPPDFVSGGIPNSTNAVNVTDLTSFLAPTRRLDTSPGHPSFNQRWDIVPGRGLFTSWINVNDLTSVLTIKPPAAPWNGSRAFGGPACTP